MNLNNSLFCIMAAEGMVFLPQLSVARDGNRTPDRRPNIVFVMTDDQGYGDLGCTGNPAIRTPFIDDFYQDALRLTNYHVGTTSTPTRGGIMTGRNCLRNGTWHTIGGCSMLNLNEKTWGEYFSEAGYATGIFGKWHLGDAEPFSPHRRGFQESVCHKGGGITQTPDYWENDYMDDVYYHNGKPEKYHGYCTDIFFSEASRFIREHAQEPFLCIIHPNAPHGPLNVPEEYAALYKEDRRVPAKMKRFYGMITNMDENFGKIRALLQELGIEENTILVFTTDNGTAGGWFKNNKGEEYGYNAGMRGRKSSQYDGGHRVPFIVRWPKGGCTGGKDYNGLTAHVDVVPTFASLAGIELNSPLPLDGQDVSGYIRKGKELDRILVTDTQRNQWPEKNKQSCVMKSTWRLVDGCELYDVSTDPGQEHNVIDRYPELAAQMQDFYDNWWKDASEDFEWSAIPIEPDHVNRLNCHDIHCVSGLPFRQDHVREGMVSAPGFFTLDFQEAGEYELVLRRYPEETGLSMSDSLILGYRNTDCWEYPVDGKALRFSSAWVEINGERYTAPVDNQAPGVTFRVLLPAGPVRLRAVLVLEDGTELNSYYVDIRKVLFNYGNVLK